MLEFKKQERKKTDFKKKIIPKLILTEKNKTEHLYPKNTAQHSETATRSHTSAPHENKQQICPKC